MYGISFMWRWVTLITGILHNSCECTMHCVDPVVGDVKMHFKKTTSPVSIKYKSCSAISYHNCILLISMHI